MKGFSMAACNLSLSGEEYADYIYRHGASTLQELRELFGTPCISYVNSDFAVVHVPLSEEQPMALENQSYGAIPALYGLLDTTSMDAAGITQSFRQPALSSMGEGTIIGFIDTGIDYLNPLFRRRDGSTRILGIWDQTAEGDGFTLPGNLDYPYDFLYGVQYSEEEINEALQSDAPLSLVPVTDPLGHGTFLSGIAAGNVSPELDFTGAAPGCLLGIVKLRPAKQYLRDYYLIPENVPAYGEHDIMMAVTYLRLLALRHRMPLVLCIGLGTNQGSHTGSTYLSLLLDSLRQYLGVAVVCAAGNETGARHHFMGRTSGTDAYEEVELRVGENTRGFIAELWASPPEVYTLGFVSPTGEVVERIPYRSGQDTTVSFALEKTSVTVSYAASIGPLGSYLASMRFQAPAPGIWRIRVYSTVYLSGFFHIWLPIRGFINEDTYFLAPDPNTTITAPANAVYPITVSTYNHQNGSIYIHSSRGYTRDGRIKPDLAAPGVDVYGPSSSRNSMTRMTGSSVAAAHVAGAAANLFSWGYVKGNDPQINNSAIKSYLTRGADRSPDFTYPNREWGYGTLNLYEAFLSLRN